MSRTCEITGKKPLVGNTVSHANNKNKRRFLPNLQAASFFSAGLKRSITVTASTNGIRTIEHKGGIDNYLLTTSVTKLLTPALRKARKDLIAKIGKPVVVKKPVRAKKPSAKKAKKAAAKKSA